MKGKIKVTSKELALGFWEFCRKLSKALYQELYESEKKKLGVELNNKQEIMLANEMVIINLWIISKVLSKEQKALDELHRIYIFGYSNLGQTNKGKKMLAETAERELKERYKCYNDTWSDNPKGGQFILALEMLEHMFDKRKSSLNVMLSYKLQTHIITAIKSLTDFLNGLERVDNNK